MLTKKKKTNKTRFPECDSRGGDDCFRPVVNKARKALGNMPPGMGEAGKAELLRIGDFLGQAVKTGARVRRCAVVSDSPCPFRPYYEKKTRKLSLCGEPVVSLKKRSRQAELLEAFQSRDWPPSIKDPLGPHTAADPENGLSDIVFRLNKKQENLRQRVHFWCDGRSVQWEIVGDELADQ